MRVIYGGGGYRSGGRNKRKNRSSASRKEEGSNQVESSRAQPGRSQSRVEQDKGGAIVGFGDARWRRKMQKMQNDQAGRGEEQPWCGCGEILLFYATEEPETDHHSNVVWSTVHRSRRHQHTPKQYLPRK